MTDRKAVLTSAIYIPALDLTPEEREQESTKFKAWYDSFQNEHAEELAIIRSKRNA